MGHHTCCNRQKVKRGLWSPEEDEKLINYIATYGHGCWSSVPRLAGLQRCGKSCRLRWINYLRPDLKRGSFSRQEAAVIIELHRVLGNKWAQIAKHLPGRTDNEVKNFWNSSIKKKMISSQQNHHPNLSQNLANSSGSSSSDQTPYLMNNPSNNFIPNPQMDQIRIPIPNPPTAPHQGFDPIESRFDQMMNYHANLVPMPPPSSVVPYPILGYLPSSPLPCINPQIIPQNQQQIMKLDNSFVFGLNAPNPLLMNTNPENLQTQPYNNQESSPMIDPTINQTTQTTENFVPASSAAEEALLDEIAAALSDFNSPMNADMMRPAPPSPMSYIESYIAALDSTGHATTASATSAATGDSSSAASPPQPLASSSFSPLPCSSSSFLDDPSFVPVWGPQP